MSKRIFLFLLFQVCQYSSATTTPKMNKLGEEKSPYLLQHAANPVNWYPWGEQAFAAARESNKLIFLSVGYSTCHWCHVMERESFENQEVIIFTFYACLWEKEYFPNLLVNLFWGQIFVFQVWDHKFWLFAYFLILLSCAARLDNIDIRNFIRAPLWIFGRLKRSKNIKGGTLIKCLISMLSNLRETLHSSAKW